MGDNKEPDPIKLRSQMQPQPQEPKVQTTAHTQPLHPPPPLASSASSTTPSSSQLPPMNIQTFPFAWPNVNNLYSSALLSPATQALLDQVNPTPKPNGAPGPQGPTPVLATGPSPHSLTIQSIDEMGQKSPANVPIYSPDTWLQKPPVMLPTGSPAQPSPVQPSPAQQHWPMVANPVQLAQLQAILSCYTPTPQTHGFPFSAMFSPSPLSFYMTSPNVAAIPNLPKPTQVNISGTSPGLSDPGIAAATGPQIPTHPTQRQELDSEQLKTAMAKINEFNASQAGPDANSTLTGSSPAPSAPLVRIHAAPKVIPRRGRPKGNKRKLQLNLTNDSNISGTGGGDIGSASAGSDATYRVATQLDWENGRVSKPRAPRKPRSERYWLDQQAKLVEELGKRGFNALQIPSGMYSCSLCEKNFETKLLCVRHAVEHLDYKPFQCASCLMEFTRCDTLQRHLKGRCLGPSAQVDCSNLSNGSRADTPATDTPATPVSPHHLNTPERTVSPKSPQTFSLNIKRPILSPVV